MNIALVFDGLGFGGIERVGIDYIRLLKSKGHQIDVYNLNPKANEMEQEIDKRCEIIHYPLARNVCPYIYTVAKRKWWWGKYIYPFVFLFFSCYQKIKMMIFRKNQSYDIVVAFSGHFNDLTFVSENYLDADKKVCWLHGSLTDYLEMAEGYLKLYKKIKNLVVLASSDKSIEKKYSYLHIGKIYNPTYVAERKLDVNKIEKLQDIYGEYFLMVGRFTKEKDHSTVLKAVKILKDKYNICRNILFVGDGPERVHIEKYAIKLGLNQQTHFMGSCFDVQNYYSAACIVLHSSPAEGLPTVLLEAMAYGVPIVATKSKPGVPEILGDDETYGLICGVGDAQSMAEKICNLINDKILYTHYQLKGKERLKDFLPETIAKKIEDYFEKIV